LWRTHVLRALSSNQGRDKLLKIAQYILRFHVWLSGISEVEFNKKMDDSYTRSERNAMTIQNTRRLFRVGRFVSEWVRIRVAIMKCSELLIDPNADVYWVLFMQSQMMLDIIARFLSCVKSVLDDVLYFSRKEVINPALHEPLERLNPKLFIPVLLIDMYLNMLRLLQCVLDKITQRRAQHRQSFSVLARYDINDMRRSIDVLPLDLGASMVSGGPGGPSLPRVSPPSKEGEACLTPIPSPPTLLGDAFPPRSINFVGPLSPKPPQPSLPSFPPIKVNQLLSIMYNDPEIYWLCATQMKTSIDLFVGVCYAYDLSVSKGIVTSLGVLSGCLSICKICSGDNQ